MLKALVIEFCDCHESKQVFTFPTFLNNLKVRHVNIIIFSGFGQETIDILS